MADCEAFQSTLLYDKKTAEAVREKYDLKIKILLQPTWHCLHFYNRKILRLTGFLGRFDHEVFL